MTHAAGPLLGSHIWAAHCNTLTDLNALSRSAVSTTGCNALDNVLHAGANSRLHDLCCVSGNVTPAGAVGVLIRSTALHVSCDRHVVRTGVSLYSMLLT